MDEADPERHWPHHIVPGAYFDGLGGINEDAGSPLDLTREGWDLYGYNPVPYVADLELGLDDRDTVRAKPTWDAVVAACPTFILKRAVDLGREVSQIEETRRICAAYIGDQPVRQTVEQEILYRQRAAETGIDISAKHAERDRRHGVANSLRARIAAAQTIEDLDAIDPTDDSVWATPTEGDNE